MAAALGQAGDVSGNRPGRILLARRRAAKDHCRPGSVAGRAGEELVTSTIFTGAMADAAPPATRLNPWEILIAWFVAVVGCGAALSAGSTSFRGVMTRHIWL